MSDYYQCRYFCVSAAESIFNECRCRKQEEKAARERAERREQESPTERTALDLFTEAQARLIAVDRVLAEYERSCDPAPYTSERALYGRLCGVLDRIIPPGATPGGAAE